MFINDLIKKPKISLIITYYNLGKYIQDCVSSILNQTYQNFEIIIVNDKSDKENSQVLSSFESNEKIKIINLSKNQGQLSAFLRGLKESQGEFICMIDADDVLLPNYLKTLLYIHLNTNCALVSSSCGEINEINEITSLNYIKNPLGKNKDKFSIEDIEQTFDIKKEFKIEEVKAPFGMWSWNPSTSSMFRKESLEILKYFPDKDYWKTGADKVVFSLLHLIGGSINTDCVCYLYRHHKENNSRTTLSTGNKKYLSEKYVNKLIAWNKKLRLDTLKMFQENKTKLIKKYNKINYINMYLKVVFCFNIKFCAKAMKAFAHKLINI